MQVFSAKVRGGLLVTDAPIDLPDGTVLTVLAPEDEECIEMSPEEESCLTEAVDEAERDDVISAAELLERLRR